MCLGGFLLMNSCVTLLYSHLHNMLTWLSQGCNMVVVPLHPKT